MEFALDFEHGQNCIRVWVPSSASICLHLSRENRRHDDGQQHRASSKPTHGALICPSAVTDRCNRNRQIPDSTVCSHDAHSMHEFYKSKTEPISVLKILSSR